VCKKAKLGWVVLRAHWGTAELVSFLQEARGGYRPGTDWETHAVGVFREKSIFRFEEAGCGVAMKVGEISRWPAALWGTSSGVPLSDAGGLDFSGKAVKWLLKQPYSCPPDCLASFGKGQNEDEEAFEKSVLKARERSKVSVAHPPSCFEPASALGFHLKQGPQSLLGRWSLGAPRRLRAW